MDQQHRSNLKTMFMRAITLITLLLFCGPIFAQMPVETFEGSFPPAGWGVYDNGIGTNFSWAQSSGSAAQPGNNSTYAAYLNRENVPSGLPADWLITPQVTLPQNPVVKFYSRLTQGGDQGSVYKLLISTGSSQGNLSSYTLVKQWSESEINPSQMEYNQITVPIPATIATPGTPVYIAFVMEADYGDRWLIDDVSVKTACNPLTNLSATYFVTTAQLTWSQPGADSWEVEIVSGNNNPTGTGVIVNGSSTYLATGLTPGSSYRYYIRSLCDGPGTWITTSGFITYAYGYSCAYPISVPSLPYFSLSDEIIGTTGQYTGNPGVGCGSLPEPYSVPAYNIYKYTAANSGQVTVEVNPELNETAIFVYADCASIGTECITGTAAYTPLQKEVTFPVVANKDYYIMVASRWGGPWVNNYSISIKESCSSATFSSAFEIQSNCETNSDFNATAILSSATEQQVTVRAYDSFGNEAATAQTVNLPSASPVSFGPFGPTDIITLVAQGAGNPNCAITSFPLSKKLCPATNNDCANAVNIIPALPNVAVPQNGTLYNATPSVTTAMGCPGSEDDDIWYTFTAGNQRQTIDIFNINGNDLDLDHALYEGSCDNMSLIYCSDDNTSIAENLVPGQTYYIRVYTSGNVTSNTTFQIRVTGYEPNCTDTNSQSVHVLDLFKKLLNHLITLGPVPDGYSCPELVALAPYITDSNPGIYNFTSEYSVSFSFAPHQANEFDVVFGPINPLIAQIDVVSYSSPEDFATFNVKLTNNTNLGSHTKRFEARHINFCPSDPCEPAAGQILLSGGLSCVSPQSSAGFNFQATTTSSIALYSWAVYRNSQLVYSSTSVTGSSPLYTFDEEGLYKVKLTLTTTSGCKSTIIRNLHVSADCPLHCTETNSLSYNIKQKYIALLNHLVTNFSTQMPAQGYSCPQLTALAPYISTASPKIYNYSNTGGSISFSFNASSTTPDVSFANNGLISDIDIFSFVSPSSSMSVPTSYNNGSESDDHTVTGVNFCPQIQCRDISGTIRIRGGLSCITTNVAPRFYLNTSAITVTSYAWTFFGPGATSQQVLGTSADEEPLRPAYTVAGIYRVEALITYGNNCTKLLKGYFTVSAQCTQCTEVNPQTPQVKEAYMSLVNHLLEIFTAGNSGTVLPNPYHCMEVDALAPFITESNPAVWNASYQNGVLKFAFTNHGSGYDVMVTAGSPLSDIGLLEFDSDNDYMQAVNVTSYFSSAAPASGHTVRHVDFCPQDCPQISGEIRLRSGQNCVKRNTTASFQIIGATAQASTYEWFFYRPDGSLLTTILKTQYDNPPFPSVIFGQNGNYRIEVVVTTNTGCKSTINSGITVSDACTSCMETNTISATVKSNLKILVNKLLHAYRAGYNVSQINVAPEMTALAPYISHTNPQISGVNYSGGTLIFSFSATDTQPDVVIKDFGDVADINLSNYTSSSQSTQGIITYTTGQQSINFFVKHLNFCPAEPECQSHVAFVIDESGSISAEEAELIREQLYSFVERQALNNTNLLVSFIPMSDSDTYNRTDKFSNNINSGTLAQAKNWISRYKRPYTNNPGSGFSGTPSFPGRSANSDYWMGAIKYAYTMERKPELIIVIADGSQTANVNGLKSLLQQIKADPATHLYVAGIKDGYYIDSNASNNYPGNPNNPVSNSVPGVLTSLELSLKFLYNLPASTFPNSGQIKIIQNNFDYFAYDNFDYLVDVNPEYFSNEIAEADLGCGGHVTPVESCDDCATFRPEPNNSYWLSAWVKLEQATQVKDYSDAYIKVVFENDVESMLTFEICRPEGEIIDGWQRVAKEFTVPPGTYFVRLELVNDANGAAAYFDDIRIHPLNGSMKTFVYDPETFRLMAEQDDNNYSTFYEYDKEGGLVRIKKETSKGIKTIQESRSGNVLKNVNDD